MASGARNHQWARDNRLTLRPFQGLYAHITVLEDIKFLLRHAAEVFPEAWEDIDPQQVKAELYQLRDRLRAERRAAVEVRWRLWQGRAGQAAGPVAGRDECASGPSRGQAMLKALRALYADTEPELVNETGEQVAKRFRVRGVSPSVAACGVWRSGMGGQSGSEAPPPPPRSGHAWSRRAATAPHHTHTPSHPVTPAPTLHRRWTR